MRDPVDKRASILLIALWSISLLTVLAVIVGSQVRQRLVAVGRLEERSQARYLLDTGVTSCISVLRRLEKTEKDTLADRWSSDPESFRMIVSGEGYCSVSYQADTGQVKDQLQVRYGMQDEESKININKAGAVLLQRLLLATGVNEGQAQEIAFSIVDWRDADSEVSSPTGSAEDSWYRNTAVPYEAKDAPFESLDELLLVRGMTGNVFERIKKYITIYGSGKININTAPPVVLAASGLSQELADKLVALRSGKDGISGSEDDISFNSPQEMSSRMSAEPGITEAQQLMLNAAVEQNVYSCRSTYFSGRLSAWLKKNRPALEAECVFERDGTLVAYRES
jgi:general secretion pathway protein K